MARINSKSKGFGTIHIVMTTINLDKCPLFDAHELDRRLLVDGVQSIQDDNGDRYVSIRSIHKLLDSYTTDLQDNSDLSEEKETSGDRMYSKSEAATYLGISESTLDRRRLTGDIKALKHGHSKTSRVVFDKTDLDQYLKSL